jgi:hypothetical protein
MKSVKNVVFALLLLFAVTANVLAGDVPIPPSPLTYQPPVTTSDKVTQSCLDPNYEQSGNTVETTDYLLFEALAALLYLY